MSEFEQLYREVILDHYKTPRNHGLLDPNDAVAEGQNPLCGDEVTVSVRFGEGDMIESVGFEGRGCAISQAATSMLTDLVKGRTAQDVAVMPKEELLDEIGIPLSPVRLKCALLGLGVLKVALHRSKGTPLPEEWGTSSGDISVELDRWPSSRSVRSTSCRRARYASSRRVRCSRSASTTATASCSRSRTGARTTTARCARATSTAPSGSSSAPATVPASTSRRGVR